MFAATQAGYASQSLGWNVANAKYLGNSLSVASQLTGPYGIALSTDGLTLYVSGNTTRGVYQYTLAAPYNLNGATYASKSASISQSIFVTGVQFSSDGTKMYVGGNTGGPNYNSAVYQYDLGTAWDVSTASYASKSLVLSTSTLQELEDIWISPAGTRLFMVSGANDKVIRATLSTAWDLSTATIDSGFAYVGTQTAYPYGLSFSPDQKRMYVTDAVNGYVYQYSLSTAGDLSTVSYTGNSFSTNTQTSGVEAIAFSSNGVRMLVLSDTNNAVYEYGL